MGLPNSHIHVAYLLIAFLDPCFNLVSLALCPLFLFYKVTSDEILGARYEFVKESEFQCCILIYNTSE